MATPVSSPIPSPAPSAGVPSFMTHFSSAMTSLMARKEDLGRDFVAGGLAGAVSRSAVAPLERLKIMYMCGGDLVRGMSMRQSLTNILKEEGFKGFFRGNGANVVRIFPFSAIQLSSYPVFKSIATEGDSRPISPVGRFWSGVSAGVLATFITYPLDFIRCRLSMQTSQQQVYRGVAHGIYTVARTEGVRQLYSGLLPSLCGIIPYAGIQLSVYDLTKDVLQRFSGKAQCGQMDFFVAGAWAGLVAQTAAFPIETIRRRMQVRGFDLGGVVDPSASAPRGGTGFIHEIQTVVRADGLRGLYRGLVPNYLKIVPAAGINFLVFEQAKNAWNKMRATPAH